MMTATVQCPNTACGRVSHLGRRSVRTNFPVPSLSHKASCRIGECRRFRVDSYRRFSAA